MKTIDGSPPVFGRLNIVVNRIETIVNYNDYCCYPTFDIFAMMAVIDVTDIIVTIVPIILVVNDNSLVIVIAEQLLL